MSKHTPGPWKIERGPYGRPKSISSDRGSICSFNARAWDRNAHEANATAARIVACVNALEGIADPVAFIAEVRALYWDAMAAIENAEPRIAAQLEAASIVDQLRAVVRK